MQGQETPSHLEVEGSGKEEIDEVEEEPLTQCAQISLQDLDGVSTFQTMRVNGYHGEKAL